MLIYYASFAFGPGPLFYVICAETFSDGVRDKAMSLANFFLWTFNLATVIAFPLLTPVLQEGGLFIMCGSIGACCTAFVYTMVAETKDIGELAPSPRSQPKGSGTPVNTKLHV